MLLRDRGTNTVLGFLRLSFRTVPMTRPELSRGCSGASPGRGERRRGQDQAGGRGSRRAAGRCAGGADPARSFREGAPVPALVAASEGEDRVRPAFEALGEPPAGAPQAQIPPGAFARVLRCQPWSRRAKSPEVTEGGGARRASEGEDGIRPAVEATGEPPAGAPQAQIPPGAFARVLGQGGRDRTGDHLLPKRIGRFGLRKRVPRSQFWIRLASFLQTDETSGRRETSPTRRLPWR